jgi:hypothetical protein
MNPDHAQHHADYPPIIEQYRGPLLQQSPVGRAVPARLEAPAYSPLPHHTAPVPLPAYAPNASKVTFWSWLGLMSSLAIAVSFLWWAVASFDFTFGSPRVVHDELLVYLAGIVASLMMSGWSVLKRKLAYNPQRVLWVGLLTSAFDLLVIFYIIYILVTLPSFRCMMSSYQNCIPIPLWVVHINRAHISAPLRFSTFIIPHSSLLTSPHTPSTAAHQG